VKRGYPGINTLDTRLGLRAEVASFDGDAQVAMASVYWRSRDDGDYDGGFTSESASTTTRRGEQVRRDDQFGNDEFEEVEEFEGYELDNGLDDSDFDDATMMDSEDPFETEMMGSEDPFETLDSDVGFDEFQVASSAQCNEPAAGEPTDAAGCAMFSGVFEGVEFDGDTAILTTDSEFLLESLAMSMNDYPRLLIELQVHTQDYAEQGRAMQLSRERVMAIARFLASEGVNVQRLRARAFGSAEPRFDDGSAESRRLNNRLALRVL
jgi:outer membrane protein OmpA-like peptidoglycan-associated protein